MNKTQIKHLENLVKTTKEAAPEAFNMSTYGNVQDGTLCGTPACVLGNYSARRDVQKAFTYKSRFVEYTNQEGQNVRYAQVIILHKNGDYVYYEVPLVQKHFGLSEAECVELFSSNGCNYAGKDKAKALKFLKAFVARKKRLFAKSKGFKSWKALQEGTQS